MKQTLKVLFPRGKKVDVRVGDFMVETDQCEKSGGEASAPEPFDFFLSSLASCAGIYALNFCHSRDLPTQGLVLEMDWVRDEKPPFNARVHYRLILPEGFPEKYRKGILRAMDLCTVKRYLKNPPEFTMEAVSFDETA
ncbi:MAG TPA: osmotically inducible protein OsmC [Gammaproteobacteria bacterium]|nr:osmotically inducible protein OsmC [Gammaproteobacteria bacterium]